MAPRPRVSPDIGKSTPSLDEGIDHKKDDSIFRSKEASAVVYSEQARDRHDIFNLVALFPMVCLMIINWDYNKVLTGHGAEESWSGEYFMFMWMAVISYFFFDLLWVARVPSCVKSPGVIIKHHICALVYLWGPVIWPEYQWIMGIILSVEINTWLLIARRVLFMRQGCTPKVVTNLVTTAFYTSWIIIRCIVFPAVLVMMFSRARDHLMVPGNTFHMAMTFIPLHLFFCLLNLKWSYELFTPLVKKFWNGGEKSVKVADGL